MLGRTEHRLLLQLARSCGIASCWRRLNGAFVHTPSNTLLRLINAITGASLPDAASRSDILSLLGEMHDERRAPDASRVVTAWDGRLKPLWLWLDRQPQRLSAVLRPEGDGAMIPLKIKKVVPIARGGKCRLRVDWKAGFIPPGYYTLDIQADGAAMTSLFLISAPRRVPEMQKGWGLFAPTYALPGNDASGIGGFGELKSAAAFVRREGGQFIGTLPLLATAYDGPLADPSPYVPLSRLFWNEIFLEPPEERHAPADIAPDFVDYARAYAVKRKWISEGAEAFFAEGKEKDAGYIGFLAASPFLEDYARFRAAAMKGEAREKEIRFHKYAQFLCHQQLSAFRAHPGTYAELYLDYPVGVHPAGFDATHFRSMFMQDVQVGAPPDMFFSKGQDWGFQPFHPRRFVEDRFRYFRETLKNYFRYAQRLRLDHIMGLYRLYCIPQGFSAMHGAYVHYPFDAFLAVLCLEAARHKVALVGEDLGTVPSAVRKAMTRHGISRMWVAQLEMRRTPEKTFRTVRPNMVACLNTHDLFPFAAYMNGADIAAMEDLGIFSHEEREQHAAERRRSLGGWHEGDTLSLALKLLAASPAQSVILNIEDLWRETQPQNIPGTSREYANWRHRLLHGVSEWPQQEGIQAAARIMNEGGRRHG